MYKGIITENQLDTWVTSNKRDAQGVIIDLVNLLITASLQTPKYNRFPQSDSMGQSGADVILHTDMGFQSYIPDGISIWEIGTSDHAGKKATEDYKKQSKQTSIVEQNKSTFVFLTPLSAARGWTIISQKTWLEKRLNKSGWKDVRIIDGTILIAWLHHFPAVELWLAEKMGHKSKDIQTAEQHWDELRIVPKLPALIPDMFLVNNDEACIRMNEIVSWKITKIQIDTYYLNQMKDFVAAYVASMDSITKDNISGRCLIISSKEEWNNIVSLQERHILIADFDMNTNPDDTIMLNKAQTAGHSVIYSGLPGSPPPHLERVRLRQPRKHQVEEALSKAYYTRQHARVFAEKSNGNLNYLLRLLNSKSMNPEWAKDSEASALAIAELLGAWNENLDTDKVVVGRLSNQLFGVWIDILRKILIKYDAPLSYQNGVWKFKARHEGWYALGPRVFDEHLERFKEICIIVLRERDPKFELHPDERFMANICGKMLTHSQLLRNGLSESLALLGSLPKALSSCSIGKAEEIAAVTVRKILADADWVLWASLNDQLPLLAEAAPNEFLDAVEKAIKSHSCPFDTVIAQEGKGFMGSNYMTGLLWALETLAWDSMYLTRVVLILGELASIDPGGQWANRPANSLTTILLPSLPQTCAPIQKKMTSVEILLREHPNVGWKLLLTLLPQYRVISMGTRKPAWREIIPDTWSHSVTDQELSDQNTAYSDLAIKVAKQDYLKLVILTKRIDDLPQPSRNHLLDYLSSEEVVSLPEDKRNELWTILVDMVLKHRKYADAKWALQPNEVNDIDRVVKILDPPNLIYHYKRLFSESDFSLYEENGNWDEQQKILEDKRTKAINEIFISGGVDAVLKFTQSIESAWMVGFAFGGITKRDVDVNILPDLLESEHKSLAQFAGSYVRKKFLDFGWQWIDELDITKWTHSQIGQLLAYLPFNPETWKRVATLLGENESQYWSKTPAHPYDTKENLDWAIDRLIQYGRLDAVIRCIEMLKYEKRDINIQQAIRTLKLIMNSPEKLKGLEIESIRDIIQVIQDDPITNPDDLMHIEWVFLPLLDRYSGASPKYLEKQLAEEPMFFCEIIQTLYISEKDEHSIKELTEKQKNNANSAYQLLKDWKLPPGSQKDGIFNKDAFKKWFERVKENCEKSGHLKVALYTVGQVLINIPPDPDGLWIDHSVAEILDKEDHGDMRKGFLIELYNSRGIYWGSSGNSERKLANKYKTQAEEVEIRGYLRLATSMRTLAESYDRDAELDEREDRYDD